MVTTPRRRRSSAVGLLLVLILIAIAVFSAVHGLLIGVLLAGFAALLFVVALVDNRYVYVSREQKNDAEDIESAGTP